MAKYKTISQSDYQRRPGEHATPGRITVKTMQYALLVLGCIAVVLPLVVVLLGSLKTNKEYLTSNVFALPQTLSLVNYKTAFTDGKVMLGLFNTAIIMLISCVGTIITGTMTAFAIQRFGNMFTRTIKALFLLATLMPSISMQVTVFQMINKMNLYNSLAAPIVLYIGTDIISIYIFMQYLSQISTSIDESAIVDGCSYVGIYFKIIFPLLQPAIATVLVIKFVGIYNDFYTAHLYMPSKKLAVVSTALYRFIGPYGAKWEIIFAGVIICIIPTLIIFVTLQKYIYSGLVQGAVKE